MNEIKMRDTLVTRDARRYFLDQLMPVALAVVPEADRARWLSVAAALLLNGEIQRCTIESVFRFVVNCLAYNLYPVPGTNTVHAVPMFNKKIGRHEVRFILGYKGLATLAYRSGHVTVIRAEIVRAGDEFEYRLGDDPKITHVVKADDIAEAVAFYAVAHLRGGERVFEVMSRGAIERHAQKYHASYGDAARSFYHQEPEAYGLKTVVRRLVTRRLPTDVVQEMVPDVTVGMRAAEAVGVRHTVPFTALADADEMDGVDADDYVDIGAASAVETEEATGEPCAPTDAAHEHENAAAHNGGGQNGIDDIARFFGAEVEPYVSPRGRKNTSNDKARHAQNKEEAQ
jgi:phage RecT family recombinase